MSWWSVWCVGRGCAWACEVDGRAHLPAADGSGSRLVDDAALGHNGMQAVAWSQKFAGRALDNSRLSLHAGPVCWKSKEEDARGQRARKRVCSAARFPQARLATPLHFMAAGRSSCVSGHGGRCDAHWRNLTSRTDDLDSVAG